MPRLFRGPDMGELDPKIKIRAPLRCDGIGRLDCAEHIESGSRLAVRWLPLEANGDAAVKACEKLPVHPTLPRIHQTGAVAHVEMETGAVLHPIAIKLVILHRGAHEDLLHVAAGEIGICLQHERHDARHHRCGG